MINKYRNWADQYPDYITPEQHTEEAEQPPSEKNDKGKEKEAVESPPGTPRIMTESTKYINFSKITLLGQQILEFTEYQANLAPVELHDPEMKNKVDLAIRTFLKHLPVETLTGLRTNQRF